MKLGGGGGVASWECVEERSDKGWVGKDKAEKGHSLWGDLEGSHGASCSGDWIRP